MKMAATVKRPQPVNIVSLEQRARALIEDMLDAPVEEQVSALTAFDKMLAAQLPDLAKKKLPPGELKTNVCGQAEMVSIPVDWLLGQWNIKGREHLLGARAYMAAIMPPPKPTNSSAECSLHPAG
jgi:hypothetical protein